MDNISATHIHQKERETFEKIYQNKRPLQKTNCP